MEPQHMYFFYPIWLEILVCRMFLEYLVISIYSGTFQPKTICMLKYGVDKIPTVSWYSSHCIQLEYPVQHLPNTQKYFLHKSTCFLAFSLSLSYGPILSGPFLANSDFG